MSSLSCSPETSIVKPLRPSVVTTRSYGRFPPMRGVIPVKPSDAMNTRTLNAKYAPTEEFPDNFVTPESTPAFKVHNLRSSYVDDKGNIVNLIREISKKDHDKINDVRNACTGFAGYGQDNNIVNGWKFVSLSLTASACDGGLIKVPPGHFIPPEVNCHLPNGQIFSASYSSTDRIIRGLRIFHINDVLLFINRGNGDFDVILFGHRGLEKSFSPYAARLGKVSYCLPLYNNVNMVPIVVLLINFIIEL
ncbi:hypothetical protein POM88_048793 [Heracleum sosnowskyi]|uniref:Uncharacterized protein n=1 Tax=Heracleum sosnowskyi TaxID=360622 RepID=A0AAD8GUF6_9APIA|nr:hypothetical protein POM88_048793 [Heracleum sosnowskyi]